MGLCKVAILAPVMELGLSYLVAACILSSGYLIIAGSSDAALFLGLLVLMLPEIILFPAPCSSTRLICPQVQLHFEIWKPYQSNVKVLAKVLLTVNCDLSSLQQWPAGCLE